MENETKNIHRNVWILAATSFLTDVSSESVGYLIPLFLYSVLGVQTSVVGLVDGIAETTASLMKIFSGAISDRLGKRKALVVIGYALSTISKPFLYFATAWDAVLGIRFTDRMGKGIRTAPRDALLASSSDKENRGAAFGISRAGDAAGAFVGILIAAIIIWFSQSNAPLLTRHTFQIIVIASVIPATLAVLVLAFGAQEIAPTNGAKSTPIKLSFKGMNKQFMIYMWIVVLFTLGNSSDSFIILRGQERGLTLLQIMLMLMTFKGVYSLLSIPAGKLSDKIGRRRLILWGWIAYGLIYLGLGLSKTGAGIWALFGLYGVYYAFTEGTSKAFIADLVPDAQRGTAYGLYYAMVGFAALPASVIAGLLWQGIGSWSGFGPGAPFYFGAILSLLAGILFFLFVKDPTKTRIQD